MTWRIIEPFAGTGAVTAGLMGAPASLVPYQGSKWKYRKAIADVFMSCGFWGVPSSATLIDAGPWGSTRSAVWGHAADVALSVERIDASGTPEDVYARLSGASAPDDPIEFAAEHLWLQRLSFSGKAIGLRDGKWRAHGLNITSAHGVPASLSFGEVKPLVPALVRALRVLPQGRVVGACADASSAIDEAGAGDVVYMDPPYAGTTGYSQGMSRDEVLSLASDAADTGARVVVSEAEPLPLAGWAHVQLQTRTQRMHAKSRKVATEWLTVSP